MDKFKITFFNSGRSSQLQVPKKKYYKKKIRFFDKTPNQNEIKKFDIIIFAIKPQIAKKVLSEYYNFEFKKNILIASIVAGKKISFFKKNIKNAIQIVRVMPNMPALIGEGVSCLVSNKNTSSNNIKTIRNEIEEFCTVEDQKKLMELYYQISNYS